MQGLGRTKVTAGLSSSKTVSVISPKPTSAESLGEDAPTFWATALSQSSSSGAERERLSVQLMGVLSPSSRIPNVRIAKEASDGCDSGDPTRETKYERQARTPYHIIGRHPVRLPGIS
jgi:hypothetical protein